MHSGFVNKCLTKMNFLGPFFHAESNSHTWILHQDQSDPEIDEEKR